MIMRSAMTVTAAVVETCAPMKRGLKSTVERKLTCSMHAG